MMFTALFSKVKSYLGLETQSRKRRISETEDSPHSKRTCIERPFALKNHATIMNSNASGNSRSEERHRHPTSENLGLEICWERKKQGKENQFNWRMLGKDVEDDSVVELDKDDKVWTDSIGRRSGYSDRFKEEVHLDDENDEEVVFLKESSSPDIEEVFSARKHSRLTSERSRSLSGLSPITNEQKTIPSTEKRYFQDSMPMKTGRPFGLMKYNFGATNNGNKRRETKPECRLDSLSVRNRIRTGNLSRAAILKQNLPPPPKYFGEDPKMPSKWSLWADRVKKKPSALEVSSKMDERIAYYHMLQRFTEEDMSSSKWSSHLDAPVFKMFESQLKRNSTFNKLLNRKTETIKPKPELVVLDCSKDDDDVQILGAHTSESQKKPPFASRDAQEASGAIQKSMKIDVQHSREVTPKYSGETTVNDSLRKTNAVDELIKKSHIADEEFISDLLSRYSIEGGRIKKEVDRENLKKQVWTDRRRSIEEAVEEKLKRYMKITDVSFDEIIIPEKEEKLPELTSEMLDTVHNALKKNRTCVLARSGSNTITGADIQTLADCNWLNDEVINNYMDMLIQRSQSSDYPSVYAFNTFFYPKLSSSGYASVRRWTKKVDIFAQDLVLIPLHLEIHWALAVIDFRQKTICYYDSMNGRKNNILQLMLNYLQEERMDKKKEKFDVSGWQLKLVQDIPQQRNGYDCGVYTCIFAEHLARGLVKDEMKKTSTPKCQSSYPPFPFSQDNMPYFRKRMIYEILKGKLLQ